jgi:hypothetical protein
MSTRRALVGLIAIITGAIVMVGSTSSSQAKDQVSDLKAILDAVPLPAGSARTSEQAYPASGDNSAYVGRDYRLPAGTTSQQIVKLLKDAHYQFVDPHTGKVDPGQATAGVEFDGGDLRILPPGRTGDGIRFTWANGRLQLSIEPGLVR